MGEPLKRNIGCLVSQGGIEMSTKWMISESRRRLASLGFALVHMLICLILLPWANSGFQRSFDTGMPSTILETLGYRVGLVISFPFAFWSLWRHPANIQQSTFIFSVITNGLLWGLLFYFSIRRLSRRARIQQGLERTRR